MKLRILCIFILTVCIGLQTVMAAESLTLSGHKNLVTSIAFHPSKDILISGSLDKSLKVWDITTGKKISAVMKHKKPITSVALSPDKKAIVSASDQDGVIKIWDLNTYKCIHTLKNKNYCIHSVAFNHDGKQIASAACNGPIKFWNVETGKRINKKFEGQERGMFRVFFDPQGKKIAAASSDGGGSVKEWDIETGKLINTFKGHSERVFSIAYSLDNKTLATGSADHTIKIWNTKTGELLRTLTGHTGRVLTVAFSPTDRVLVSGAEDDTIRFWDIDAGGEQKAIKVNDSVFSVGFTTDGTRVAGAFGNVIKLFSLKDNE